MSNKTLKKIVIGNWKMNPSSIKEAEKLFTQIARLVSEFRKVEIVACVPFLYIDKLRKISKKISLGAQNVFWEEGGPFTGEISAEMLYDAGIRYVIVGHSERRAMGEDNLSINKKLKASIKAGLRPILCVGESVRDQNHEYLDLVKKQIEECLNGISKNSVSKIIIAYEPVWAIGAGASPATPEEFREMNVFIRKILSDKFGIKEVSNVKIIYGGSVDEKNVEDFLRDGQTNGFLPGRVSLKPEKFSKIVKICEVSNK